MSTQTIRPGLTAAMRVGRELLAAGWRYDSTTPMAGDTTERTMLHPSGREISARTTRDGDSTDLTMTGLSLEQVAHLAHRQADTYYGLNRSDEVARLLERLHGMGLR